METGNGDRAAEDLAVSGGIALLFAIVFIALGTIVHGRGSHVAAAFAAAFSGIPIVWAARRRGVWEGRPLEVGVLLVVALQALLGVGQLLRGMASGSPRTGLLVGLVVVLVVLAFDNCRVDPRMGRWSAWLLLGTFAVLGVVWLVETRPAMIDVLVYQRLGAERLLSGVDPYVFGYPDIYPPENSARFFGPGLSIDGVLQFGFPYPPVSLLLSTSGHVVGDVRLAHLAAFVFAGWATMALDDWGWHGRVGGVLLLTTPTALTVLTFGWTEPFVVAAVAVAVLGQVRSARWAFVARGVLIAVKQYGGLLVLPLVILGESSWGRRLRALALASSVALLITVPIALWHPRSFLFSVVELHLEQPFRPDSMSLVAVLVNGLGTPPSWVFPALVVATPLTVLGWARVRVQSDMWRVVLVAGLTMLAFLLVSKQAFINYYLVVTALLCLSFALGGRDDVSRARP